MPKSRRHFNIQTQILPGVPTTIFHHPYPTTTITNLRPWSQSSISISPIGFSMGLVKKAFHPVTRESQEEYYL